MLLEKPIEQLDEDAPLWSCPTLLDANAVDKMLDWLDVNQEYVKRLENKTWRVAVLREYVETHPERRAFKRRLRELHIETTKQVAYDDKFINEILQAYFGGDTTRRKSALLLAYGRQQTDEGDDVRIISRHTGFRLIPRVQLFTVPTAALIEQDDDATYLRAMVALDLHKKVRGAAYQRVIDRDYPTAIVETVKAFFEEVRQIGLLHGEAYGNEDGRDLINSAFDFSRAKNTLPKIKLNPCNTDSEQNEQKGYHSFASGIASAMRNPIAHAPVDTAFIQDRFGDKETALKALCLLSLLFEKLEDRDAPR